MRASHVDDLLPPTFLVRIAQREDGCWQWIGASDRYGYGLFTYERRRRIAHRVAYELFIGQIPDGLEIDHLCRNRLCVNPTHLEPVTHLENMLRSPRWTPRPACPHGHEFTPDNTGRERSGKRYCRECNRLGCAAYRRRQKAASEEAA